MTRVLLLSLLSVVVSCYGGPPGPNSSTGSGQLAMRWVGSAEGSFSARVQGVRCLDERLVEVLGFRSDSGAGFTLWLGDSLTADLYRIGSSATPVPVRPSASVALRWFAEIYIAGFEAHEGWVQLDQVRGDTISGTLEVRMRGVERPDTLLMTGVFRDIPLVADTTCPVRRV